MLPSSGAIRSNPKRNDGDIIDGYLTDWGKK